MEETKFHASQDDSGLSLDINGNPTNIAELIATSLNQTVSGEEGYKISKFLLMYLIHHLHIQKSLDITFKEVFTTCEDEVQDFIKVLFTLSNDENDLNNMFLTAFFHARNKNSENAFTAIKNVVLNMGAKEIEDLNSFLNSYLSLTKD